MIHNITDRERSLEAVVAQLSQGRDALAKRVEALEAENARLRAAMAEARAAIGNWPEGAEAMLDDALTIWDQLADIGASDPRAWDKI